MNNLLSYCGLVDAKIRASDIDLPLQVRIDLKGVPCKPYRVWVCSVLMTIFIVLSDPIDPRTPRVRALGSVGLTL